MNAQDHSHASQTTLRTVDPSDLAFLFDLYTSVRPATRTRVDMDAPRDEFHLQAQFNAMLTHCMANFPGAEHNIVLLGEQPIGVLYVDRVPEEIRLIDMTLLPRYRYNGVGTGLLQALQQEAASSGRPLRFYVWRGDDAALSLTERTGFRQLHQAGAHICMEWRPPI